MTPATPVPADVATEIRFGSFDAELAVDATAADTDEVKPMVVIGLASELTDLDTGGIDEYLEKGPADEL